MFVNVYRYVTTPFPLDQYCLRISHGWVNVYRYVTTPFPLEQYRLRFSNGRAFTMKLSLCNHPLPLDKFRLRISNGYAFTMELFVRLFVSRMHFHGD